MNQWQLKHRNNIWRVSERIVDETSDGIVVQGISSFDPEAVICHIGRNVMKEQFELSGGVALVTGGSRSLGEQWPSALPKPVQA